MANGCDYILVYVAIVETIAQIEETTINQINQAQFCVIF